MLWLLSGPPEFTCLILFATVFSFIYCCFISFLYLDLYVLRDDSLISYWYFMKTKHLCVWIHILIKGEVGAA